MKNTQTENFKSLALCWQYQLFTSQPFYSSWWRAGDGHVVHGHDSGQECYP